MLGEVDTFEAKRARLSRAILSAIVRVPVLFARWVDAFWGYDVFIAHRRLDAAAYAVALRDRLRQDGIGAFLDQVEYGPGDNLYLATSRHVRKSSILLVVGSPELLVPRVPIDWVAREIETYLASHSKEPMVLVLDFGGQIVAASESRHAARTPPPYIERLRPHLHLGLPADLGTEISDEILSAIRRLLRGRRRDRRRLAFFQAVAGLLLLLVILASTGAVVSLAQRDSALTSEAEILAQQARAETAKWPERGVAVALAALPNPDGLPRPFRRPLQPSALAALSDALYQLGGSRYVTLVENPYATINAFGMAEDGRFVAFLNSRDMGSKKNDYAAVISINAKSGERSILRVGKGFHPVASNGGDLLAYGTEAREIVVMNLPTGSIVGNLHGHSGSIWDIALDRDGRLVATGGGADDGTARLWSIATREVVAQTSFDGSGVTQVEFVPNSPYLLVRTEQAAYLWPAQQNARPMSLTSPGSLVRTIAASAKGDRVAVGTSDGVVKVWSMPGQSLVFEGQPFTDLNAMAFSPDGKCLAVVGIEGEARIYDLSNDAGKFISLRHEGDPLLRDVSSGPPLLRTVIFPDGDDIVITTADGGDVRVWRTSTGRLLKKIDITPDPYTSSTLAEVTSTPSGQIGGGLNGTAYILDPRAGTEQLRLEPSRGPITAAAISPNGRTLAVMYENFRAIFWDVSTGLRLLEIGEEVGSAFEAVFDRTGRTLVTGSHDHIAKQWDARDGTSIATFPTAGGLKDVAVSADGALVATASDTDAAVWTAGIDAPVLRVVGSKGVNFEHIGFAVDDSLLLAGRSDGVLEVWSIAAKQRRFELRPVKEAIRHLAISPDGASVADAFKNGTTVLLDIESGTERIRFDLTDEIQSLNFAPDGSILAAGRIDGSVGLWRADDGTALATLPAGGGEFPGTAFSPDGSLIVTFSAYGDGIARVWDTGSGELISELAGHNRSVITAAFLPSGQRLITASIDGTVLVWKTPSRMTDWAALVRAGCAALDHYPPRTGRRDWPNPPFSGQKPPACETSRLAPWRSIMR